MREEGKEVSLVEGVHVGEEPKGSLPQFEYKYLWKSAKYDILRHSDKKTKSSQEMNRKEKMKDWN